jgi:hypothetical protein
LYKGDPATEPGPPNPAIYGCALRIPAKARKKKRILILEPAIIEVVTAIVAEFIV